MKNKQSAKQKNLHRIKIIGGHIRAIEEMINESKYCVDIIHQSLAVQKALKRLDMALMKDHLNTCVVGQIRNGETDKSIDELLRLYEMK
ncbi:MAG: metal-sensitive transcriptional regulator [Candidatus Dojkabacteria bacterium]